MDQKQNFTQTVNLILALLLVVALVTTVYAINSVRSISPKAASKNNITTIPTNSACLGQNASAKDITGKVSSRGNTTEQVTLCPNSTQSLAVFLRWDNGKKDLFLTVTDPSGVSKTVDTHGQNNEGMSFPPILTSGIWTLKVGNNSSGPVSYTLSVFVY